MLLKKYFHLFIKICDLSIRLTDKLEVKNTKKHHSIVFLSVIGLQNIFFFNGSLKIYLKRITLRNADLFPIPQAIFS